MSINIERASENVERVLAVYEMKEGCAYVRCGMYGQPVANPTIILGTHLTLLDGQQVVHGIDTNGGYFYDGDTPENGYYFREVDLNITWSLV